jgi:hypothetical protein
VQGGKLMPDTSLELFYSNYFPDDAILQQTSGELVAAGVVFERRLSSRGDREILTKVLFAPASANNQLYFR